MNSSMKDLINNISNPAQYFHCIIDLLCGGDGKIDSYFKDNVEALRLAPLFQKYIESIAGTENLSDNLTAKLSESGVSNGVAKIIENSIIARLNEIKSALVRRNCAISYAHLSDFDWSIRMVMGSDKLSSIRERALILTLLIKKPDGAKEEIVIEMTKEDLDTFLSHCGAVNTVLQSIS